MESAATAKTMDLRAPGILRSDVVDLFQDLGLTAAEIRIYQYLLRGGSAGCSDIAREARRPRSRIYDEMRALVAKGFAREEAERPIRFSPSPMSEILGLAKLRLSRHMDVVRREQDGLAVRPQVDRSPSHALLRMRDIRVVAGRRACMAELSRVLAQSRRFFWLMGGGNFAERLGKMPRLQENLAFARRQGIDLRLLVPAPLQLTPSELWLDMSFGAAMTRLRPELTQAGVLTCVTESTVLEVIVQPDDAAPNLGDDIALRVSSPVYAAAVCARLEWARKLLAAQPEGAVEVPARPEDAKMASSLAPPLVAELQVSRGPMTASGAP